MTLLFVTVIVDKRCMGQVSRQFWSLVSNVWNTIVIISHYFATLVFICNQTNIWQVFM